MEATPNEESNAVEQSESSEREASTTARIYVASLSDYNAGRLHGTWLDATVGLEALEAGVTSMLASSPSPGAEEWAIHDYEGFGPLHLSEYESLSTVAALAAGLTEHGPAFMHWAAFVGTGDSDALERFEDAYLGHAENIENYAAELLDDLGVQRQLDDVVPESLHAYVKFDVEAFARDLELGGDVIASETEDGVYLFSGDM